MLKKFFNTVYWKKVTGYEAGGSFAYLTPKKKSPAEISLRRAFDDLRG
jgi:hypothetical protein